MMKKFTIKDTFRFVIYIVIGLMSGIAMKNLPVGISIGMGMMITLEIALNGDKSEDENSPQMRKRKIISGFLLILGGLIFIIDLIIYLKLRSPG